MSANILANSRYISQVTEKLYSSELGEVYITPFTEELYISELPEYIHILANHTYISEYISQLTVY